MAVALEIGVGNLVAEFLTHALVLLRPLQAAGAVSAGALQALPDSGNNLFIFIQPN